jgi:hypothetical protein
MSKLFTTILPSLLAGGLLFGSALTVAQPAPPAPPSAPLPPRPPKAPKIKGDVHIDLSDINQVVDEQIKNALEAIGNNPRIPPHVREAMKQRLEKVRIKVKKRVAKISPDDLEQVGEELGKMGEEIGDEMEQFGKDMEKWGKEFEKNLEKQMQGKKVLVWKGQHNGSVSVDIDGDDDMISMDDMDDADDLDDAMKDMGDLKLDQGTRARLKQFRVDSDAKVASAKRQLDVASENLRKQLENDNANEDEIKRAIDTVSGLEADIRKARILAWVKARKLLDASQRKQVEAAARGKSH